MDQPQVLQRRNVFSASYINLHIIRTVLNTYKKKKRTIERKMQISKVDDIYCALRYNIWQIEHTSKTILKHVVYVCCIHGSYCD